MTFDLPGHGTSSLLSASLDETADLLASSLPDEPVALGGYSLGARVALHVALRHSTRVNALVLLGATRGIEDLNERAARKQRDDELADRIESIGTNAFLDEWLSQPMFASLPHDALERASRSSDPLGLANSLRRSGTGTQEFLGPRLNELTSPVLCLAGERDEKFRVEAETIATHVRYGTFETIAQAAHAAHLEQPERSAQVVAAFLAR